MRRIGDRRDGRRIRKIDPMHFVTPMIYPNRCDNEAFIQETIDLTKAIEYLKLKNKDKPEIKYNLFQIILTAGMKTFTLRPKMNRFVANKALYQRNEVSGAFVIKKDFADNGDEALAIVHTVPSDNLDSIRMKMNAQVLALRGETVDASTKTMAFFSKLPICLVKPFVAFVRFLDRRGKVPKSFVETDPYYCSIVFSNLGSIGLQTAYHHLTNWGTTSMFTTIGPKKYRPFYKRDGSIEMKQSIQIGITVDERIADGFYYSKSVKLFKRLIENPELLEGRLDKEV